MREGRILADDSPAALRDRTGTETVEAAFLHLVDEANSRQDNSTATTATTAATETTPRGESR
jgi:ABC-2 type transport system ATP-binding protein